MSAISRIIAVFQVILGHHPMGRLIDLTGQRFGRLAVIGRAENDRRGKYMWLVICACGNEKVVSGHNLRSGRTSSCGCFHRQGLRERNLRHGHAVPGKRTPEYMTYLGAKARCSRPKHQDWPNYGGRGVEFRFKSFGEFLTHLGPRPAGLTLDRINNEGHYQTGNCQWATRKQQANNRRPRRKPGQMALPFAA